MVAPSPIAQMHLAANGHPQPSHTTTMTSLMSLAFRAEPSPKYSDLLKKNYLSLDKPNVRTSSPQDLTKQSKTGNIVDIQCGFYCVVWMN